MNDENVTVGKADLRTALRAMSYEPQIYSVLRRFGETLTEPEQEALAFAYEVVQEKRDAAIAALGLSLEDFAPPEPAAEEVPAPPLEPVPPRATVRQTAPEFT